MKFKTIIKQIIIVFILLNLPKFTFAQEKDTIKVQPIKYKTQFSGAVNITNNGISFIPAFSLGKPAVMFDFAARGKRLSFEPQLNFAIKDAKPWQFLFWVRYKLIESKRFKLRIGTHPAFVFSNPPVSSVSSSKAPMFVNRSLVGELSPNYMVSKNASVGLYYLYAKGLNEGIPQNGHFLGLNTFISNIKLSEQFYFRFSSMVYYLNLDKKDGFYVTSTLNLTKKNCPFSVSTLFNKIIKSNIPSKNLVGNVSLTYSF